MRAGLFILVATLLAGCVNNYEKFYHGVPDARLQPGYVPSTEPVAIFRTNDPKADIRQLIAKGYFPIGESLFNAGTNSATQKQLITHATNIGAQVVLTMSHFTHTVSGAMPMMVPSMSTSVSTGNATAYGPEGSVTAYGTGTTNSYGSYTAMVPYTVQRADFYALYFAKVKPKLGVVVIPVDNETRQRLESNSGVRVDIVVEDSNAFHADILPGDVIFRFNDTAIRSVEHCHELINRYKGTEVNLAIYRNGKVVVKTVPFSQS